MTKFISSKGRLLTALSIAGLLSAPLFAQTELPALPLAQINRPAGWQLAGSVTSGADGTLKTGPGSSVLVGSRDPLPLAPPTDDFRMRFELATSPSADVSLLLPNGQSLPLQGTPDLARLLKAPGLWQTVELWYRAGKANGGAMLEKLVINGVTVREGQLLQGKATNPVRLAAPGGLVAIRNVGYRVLSPRTVARWSGPLRYKLYEGWTKDRSELSNRKLIKEDTSSAIDMGVAHGQSRFIILYTGTLNVGNASANQPADYLFDLHAGGDVAMWIDGKEIVPAEFHDLNRVENRRLSLAPGPHQVEIMLARSWTRPALGLFVSQVDTRPQPLHIPESLPEPEPISVISVRPTTRPELIRSFVQLAGEKAKRTHSLSVGSPDGYHYTLDLNQMALLQAWKGDFANTTEMWHERGEPQLLEPMGATVRLPAQPAVAIMTNEATAWPDSLGDNVLQYRGLTVDKAGYPTVEYAMAGSTIIDAVRPGADGLNRTLTFKGSPDGTAYCRVAAGSTLEEISKGLYAVNDRSYFVRFDPKTKVKLRQSGGKQELLLPVDLKSGTGIVQYSVVF